MVRARRVSRSGASHHDYIRFLDFHSIVRCLLCQSFIMVVNRHGKITLGIILPDDILVQISLNIARFGQLGQIEPQIILLLVLHGQRIFHNPVSLLRTVAAYKTIHSGNEQRHIALRPAAKRTCFLHRHCIYGLRTSLADSGFLRTKTLSIIPYSLASCAVIQ